MLVNLLVLLGVLAGPTGLPVPPMASCRSTVTDRSCPAFLVPVATPSGWKFSRTQGARESESFASITKTANTARSDPDFAGLIIRCAPKGKIEVLIALIQPFPPRSRPQVTVTAGSFSQTFEASMAAAGAAVLLPEETGALVSTKWQAVPSLKITVRQETSEIKGMVDLGGLGVAYNSLITSCAQ